MFGLSTQEVEVKNVHFAYLNNIDLFYELMKKSLSNLVDYDIEDVIFIVDENKRKYFDKSKEDIFTHLRTKYKNIDSKFDCALNKHKYNLGAEVNSKVYGYQAGILFYYIYIAIMNKEPKPENCISLNNTVNSLINKELSKIQKELNL